MLSYRSGYGIREFLEYYVLVVLDEEASTRGKIVRAIQERSSDNTQYSPEALFGQAGQWRLISNLFIHC